MVAAPSPSRPLACRGSLRERHGATLSSALPPGQRGMTLCSGTRAGAFLRPPDGLGPGVSLPWCHSHILQAYLAVIAIVAGAACLQLSNGVLIAWWPIPLGHACV